MHRNNKIPSLYRNMKTLYNHSRLKTTYLQNHSKPRIYMHNHPKTNRQAYLPTATYFGVFYLFLDRAVGLSTNLQMSHIFSRLHIVKFGLPRIFHLQISHFAKLFGWQVWTCHLLHLCSLIITIMCVYSFFVIVEPLIRNCKE